MPVKSLGHFLLERGAITQQMLLDAIQFQSSRIKPLCDAAVQTGQATREEFAKLDEKAAGRPAARKRQELRNKIHSMEQLESSWRTLSERGVFLVEALARNAGLSMEELDRLCSEYRQATAVAEVNLQTVLPDAPETRDILESLIEIALDLFAHYTGQIPSLLSMGRSLDDIAPDSYVFAQAISGDIDVDYVILLPAKLVLNVASHILQEPVAAVDANALDAVTEFLNVVVGNTCTKFSMRNYHVTTAPPRTQPLADFMTSITPGPIVVRAGVPDGEFHLVYVFSPRTP